MGGATRILWQWIPMLAVWVHPVCRYTRYAENRLHNRALAEFDMLRFETSQQVLCVTWNLRSPRSNVILMMLVVLEERQQRVVFEMEDERVLDC